MLERRAPVLDKREDWNEVNEETRRIHHGEVPEFRAIDMELLWKCLNCGFLIPRDAEPPTVCPECGAPESQFEALI
jgi:rubrerythrin